MNVAIFSSEVAYLVGYPDGVCVEGCGCSMNNAQVVFVAWRFDTRGVVDAVDGVVRS